MSLDSDGYFNLETVTGFISAHPIISIFVAFILLGILFGKKVVKDLEAQLTPTEDFIGQTQAYGEIEFKEYKGDERALEILIKKLADYEGQDASVHVAGIEVYRGTIKNGRIFAQLSTKKNHTNIPDVNQNDAVTIKVGIDTVLKGVFVPD